LLPGIALVGALALVLALASQAGAASGNWDRAWGKDVNGGGVFGVCTVAASCLPGTFGGLGGELNGAQGVATDAAGNVYVADRTNNRIQKFDSLGNWQRTWGKGVNGGGGFEVCAAASSCQAGTPGALGGEMNLPAGVATDAAGNVYVADSDNNRIQKFDSFGNFQRAWGKGVNGGGVFEVCTVASSCQAGTTGGLGGEMNIPLGVATDAAGNVYVSDRNNNRIQKFDSSGNFLRAWGKDVIQSGHTGDTGTGFEICTVAADCQVGTSGGLGGEMNIPFGVTTDAGGNLYVTDTQNNRVQKFDSSGNWDRAWGKDVNGGGVFGVCTVSAGCQPGTTGGLGGEMASPNDVATDAAGNVYVADGANNRIQKFDSLGNFQRAWGKNVNGGGVFGVCTVSAGCLAGTTGGLGGEMSFPTGVATDAVGNLYVTDGANFRIQRFADPLPPGGGGGGGGESAAMPSNTFAIGKLRRKTLTVSVSSAGVVRVTDAGARGTASRAIAAAKRLLKPSSASGGPGPIKVTLRLTKLGNQRLRQKGKVTVNARITFTPSGGIANSQTARLKIKRK